MNSVCPSADTKVPVMTSKLQTRIIISSLFIAAPPFSGLKQKPVEGTLQRRLANTIPLPQSIVSQVNRRRSVPVACSVTVRLILCACINDYCDRSPPNLSATRHRPRTSGGSVALQSRYGRVAKRRVAMVQPCRSRSPRGATRRHSSCSFTTTL
jgi:hypothetical protein